MEKRRSIFMKLGMVVFAAGWLLLCTMLLNDSGEFYAESKDGLWKGYITKCAGSGQEYEAYLCYLGNAEGNVGEIEIFQFCNDGKKPCKAMAEHVPVSVAKHFSSAAPRKAYRIGRSEFDQPQKMTFGISWRDKEGEPRYSSLIFSS